MKRTCLIIISLFWLMALSAQQKTIAERLGLPKNAKLLIIHADDVGVSHAVNAATVTAIEKGCVNSASIMVPCPWFVEIASYAREHPGLDLGLHITLTSEWSNYKWGPVTPLQQVPTLVNRQGFLYSTTDSVKQFASSDQVEEEIRNQVKRAIQFGIDPTHLDAHMGAALSKLDFLQAYVKVGREYKIPVFVPRGLDKYLNINFDNLLAKDEVIVDSVVSISPENMRSGASDFYPKALRNLGPGLTYFIIHTAHDNEEMRAVTKGFTDWGSAWRQTEFDFFTSPECGKLLKENNIHIVSWKQIRDKLYR